MRVQRLFVVLAAGLLTTGCGSADEPAVRDAAASFAAGDPGARCGLLAPTTMESLVAEEQASCPEAIAELPVGTGAVVSVEVWGEDALVHLDDDTLFLTRDGGGWWVSAAACSPAGEGPYECQLEAS